MAVQRALQKKMGVNQMERLGIGEHTEKAQTSV